MNGYDFSTAEPNTFELVPEGQQVPVILKFINGDSRDDLHATTAGTGRMAKFELVVTDGPYAKRKIFMNLMLASTENSDGHKKAIEISRSTIRAMLEAARGFSPTDESAQAIAARQIKRISDLDQIEFSVLVGIEKGSGGYQDKNVLKRVVAIGKKGDASHDPAADAASMRSAPPTGAQKAVGGKGGWL